MNRREALKNIGLSASYIAATPTVFSILQSCKKETRVLDWTPELLSIDQSKVLEQLVDLILPETDIPGAKSLHVPMFIDKYIKEVTRSEEEIKLFTDGATAIVKELGVNENKSIDDITLETYHTILTKYLKMPKAQQQEYQKKLRQLDLSDTSDRSSPEFLSYTFLTTVRELSIFGFKTSEEIGKNVLNYSPVPGEYIGCDAIQNLTEGKDWAL